MSVFLKIDPNVHKWIHGCARPSALFFTSKIWCTDQLWTRASFCKDIAKVADFNPFKMKYRRPFHKHRNGIATTWLFCVLSLSESKLRSTCIMIHHIDQLSLKNYVSQNDGRRASGFNLGKILRSRLLRLTTFFFSLHSLFWFLQIFPAIFFELSSPNPEAFQTKSRKIYYLNTSARSFPCPLS